jgi:hypothetical protein
MAANRKLLRVRGLDSKKRMAMPAGPAAVRSDSPGNATGLRSYLLAQADRTVTTFTQW